MKKIAVSVLALLCVSCASKTTESGDSRSSTAHMKEATPTDSGNEASESQVLSKPKKCPKNSRLVSGKCMLQVESDE